MESGKYDEKVLSNLEEKKYIEIIKNIDKEIILNPKDSLSFYHRALAHHYLNKLEDSHRDFKSAIYFLPNDEKELYEEIFNNYEINLSKKNATKIYFLVFLICFMFGLIITVLIRRIF